MATSERQTGTRTENRPSEWFPKIPSGGNIRCPMGIDDLKARFRGGAWHDALVDLRVGLKVLKDALDKTARDLTAEREQLTTAERRGQLAEDIGDAETAAIARQFADKHRQRVDLLDRKLGVQRDELTLAEQEFEAVSAQQRSAGPGVPEPPDEDPGLLKAKIDREAARAAVDTQLELLKKKMGKGS